MTFYCTTIMQAWKLWLTAVEYPLNTNKQYSGIYNMNIESFVIPLVIIIIAGILMYAWTRYKDDNNTVYENLASENEQLTKKAVALEQKVAADKDIINDLLTQQKSYDTMDRYIKHLETTVQNLTKTTDDVKQEEPKDE